MPNGFTRSTHTVRIYSGQTAGQPQTATTGTYYADVEILDAIAFTLPNDTELCYTVGGSNPYIVDDTGDGNEKPLTDGPTRKSHMSRLTGIANKSQFFDVETCDAFVLIGPDGTDHAVVCPTALSKSSTKQPGSSAISFIIDNEQPFFTDPTNGGLGVGFQRQNTSRAQHIVQLQNQVGGGSVNPSNPGIQTPEYALALITDGMGFTGPSPHGLPMMKIDTEFLIPGPADDDYNYQGVASQTFSPPMWGDIHGLQFSTPDIWFKGALSPNAKCNDTTIYVTDPVSGQLVPPPPDPNVDKNVYVYFPTGSGGPFLGAGQAIDMGPLWWIRQLGTTINVWYWYITPVQHTEGLVLLRPIRRKRCKPHVGLSWLYVVAIFFGHLDFVGTTIHSYH